MARTRTRPQAALATTALLLLGAVVGCAAEPDGADREPGTRTSSPATTAPPSEAGDGAEAADAPIRVIALGDLLPHDSVNQNAASEDGGYDYAPFFDGIRSQLDAADVTFCNQEVPSAGTDFGISGYPVFNAPVEFARDLHGGAGCDLVNLANNHAADQGAEGIAATRAVWDGLAPSVAAGANRSAEEQRDVPVFETDGVRIALVSLAEYSNAPIDEVSLNLLGDTALVQDLMTRARDTADAVIVSAHWGTEDTHEVNDQQAAFAQQLADLGADVIVGTGPHVLQPATWIDRADGGRTLVWYSIGNMLSTQLTLDERTGAIAGFELRRSGPGDEVRVENPTAILTYMHYDWSAEQEAAGDLAARTKLSLTPLAASDGLLERTRFGVTAEEQVAASAAILGPDVSVVAE